MRDCPNKRTVQLERVVDEVSSDNRGDELDVPNLIEIAAAGLARMKIANFEYFVFELRLYSFGLFCLMILRTITVRNSPRQINTLLRVVRRVVDGVTSNGGFEYIELVAAELVRLEVAHLDAVAVEVQSQTRVAEEGGVEGHPGAVGDDPARAELGARGAVERLVVRHGRVERVRVRRVRRVREPQRREHEHVLARPLVHVHLRM